MTCKAMMKRHSHTTKTGKAKCLSYRDGKRCGRIAKVVVESKDHIGYHKMSVCDECAVRMVEQGGCVIIRSKCGFRVVSSAAWSGMVARMYVRIEPKSKGGL